MLGRSDLVPWIAGDDPADGRLVLERIEIFRFAAEQIHHDAILKDAASVTLTDECGQVATEQGAEDSIGL